MNFCKNIERKEIHLPTELTMDFVPDFISTVNEIISISSKERINLYCSSYGGDLYAAFGIIDYINSLDIKINTICFGAAISAASIILASGTGERVMSKNSTVMVHEGSAFEAGKTTDVMKGVDHLKDLQKNINKILGEVSNKDAAFWEKIQRNDTYLTAPMCLDYGIIDKIA